MVPADGSPETELANLRAAITAITGALASASDATIPALVAERAAMRDELRALERAAAGNVIEMAARTR